MAKRRMDRRISRTRALLQQALCTLLRRKRYEAITVDDICATASVGRSTFYAHFGGKDDLKRSGLESLHGVLAGRQKAARGRKFDFSLGVFEHARDHVDHYRSLVGGRGGTVALAKVRQMVADLVRKELAATGEDLAEAMPPELVVQYVVGAYMAVLTWWLDGGAKLPPERLDAMFRRLATHGVLEIALQPAGRPSPQA